MRMLAKGKKFLHILAEGSEYPVFSESFLYEVMCKDDARFILGVGEEYQKIIEILGTVTVKRLLEGLNTLS